MCCTMLWVGSCRKYMLCIVKCYHYVLKKTVTHMLNIQKWLAKPSLLKLTTINRTLNLCRGSLKSVNFVVYSATCMENFEFCSLFSNLNAKLRAVTQSWDFSRHCQKVGNIWSGKPYSWITKDVCALMKHIYFSNLHRKGNPLTLRVICQINKGP